MSLTINKKGSVYYLSGAIDENVELDGLLWETSSLILNLANISKVNSIGARKWVEFIKKWGLRDLELHECAIPFIDIANLIPLIVGFHGSKAIKSFFAPFICEKCNLSQRALLNSSAITVSFDEPKYPPQYCQKCKGGLIPDCDLRDFFSFLVSTT